MVKRKDQEFLTWLSFQKSCLDGEFSEYVNGVGRNIACHVRHDSKGGVGFKPLFFAVPMTFKQHAAQSGPEGELGAVRRFHPYYYAALNDCPGLTPKEKAKLWFDKQAHYYMQKWKSENGK